MSTDKKEEQKPELKPDQINNAENSPGIDSVGNSTGATSVGLSTVTNGTQGAPLSETTKRELIAALKQNWQREMEGVRTYRDLASKERDATKRGVLEKMADAEARHAQKWERKLAELGVKASQEE